MATLVCSPHPDDEMIGMGGTIAKFASEGEDVIVCIFTLGEGSHPWQKRESINETRRAEALAAGKIAGVKKTYFLELDDLKLATEVVEKNTEKDILRIIKEDQIDTIFMPALDDVHADHRALARFILATHESNKLTTDVWMYTVWNPLHVQHRDKPKLVVDITKHFPKKWKAINAYHSQKVSTFQLIPTVMLRGLWHGLQHRCTMAEVFLKAA